MKTNHHPASQTRHPSLIKEGILKIKILSHEIPSSVEEGWRRLRRRGGLGMLVAALFCILLILPLTTFAQAGIVPCGDQKYTKAQADSFNAAHKADIDAGKIGKVFEGGVSNPCEFNDFIDGIKNIIDFLLMITGSIAALVFAYSVFLVLTAGSNEGQVTKAKEMSWSVVKGFALMISAWLLVKLVLTALGVTGAFNLLK